MTTVTGGRPAVEPMHSGPPGEPTGEREEWLADGPPPALAEGIGRWMSAAFSPDGPGWRDAVPRAGTGVLHAALAGPAPEMRPRPARP
ncbi:hypothetical protein QZH56_04325 [Streptomyces olivoreticuli]|uniref:hypothetical protein n=1 Tax=Streptomyces olivoreticuli TaxID=68246 RepID=UPI0026599E6D|nr:hypothetical protein [Streptomyces olivoreticuli]WKK24861.1 hypothetical protein QZH56_04325 [Streptomyces olivoreticuli]